jgi:hypothetical protein
VCVTSSSASRVRAHHPPTPRARSRSCGLHGMGQDSSNSPPTHVPTRSNPIHSIETRRGLYVDRSMLVYVYV